jgi:predicted  nucleic acid-binding Zn-ribbon protein
MEQRVTVLEHQMAERNGRLDREVRLAAERDREISAINTLLDEHSKMHLSHRDALIALDGKVTALDGKVTALDGRVASLEREVSGLRGDLQSGFATLQRATEALAVKLDRLSPE